MKTTMKTTMDSDITNENKDEEKNIETQSNAVITPMNNITVKFGSLPKAPAAPPPIRTGAPRRLGTLNRSTPTPGTVGSSQASSFRDGRSFHMINSLRPDNVSVKAKKSSIEQLELIHGLKSIANIRLGNDEPENSFGGSIDFSYSDSLMSLETGKVNPNMNIKPTWGDDIKTNANPGDQTPLSLVLNPANYKLSTTLTMTPVNAPLTPQLSAEPKSPNMMTLPESIPESPSVSSTMTRPKSQMVGAQRSALSQLHLKYQTIKVDNGDWIPFLADHMEPTYPSSLYVASNITQLFIGGSGFSPSEMIGSLDFHEFLGTTSSGKHKNKKSKKHKNKHNNWENDAFYQENSFWTEEDGGGDFVCSILKYSLSFGNPLSSIREISFRDSNLDDYALEKICKSIKQRYENNLPPLLLKRLIFNKNMKLTDYSMAILFETIGEYCCNLEELDLSEINISDRSCAIIYDFYKKYHFDKIADLAALGSGSPKGGPNKNANIVYNNYIYDSNDNIQQSGNKLDAANNSKELSTIVGNKVDPGFVFGVSLHRIGLLSNKQITMNGINRLNALFTDNIIQENKFSEIISNTWDKSDATTNATVSLSTASKRKVYFEIVVSVPFAYEKSELIKTFDSRIRFFE